MKFTQLSPKKANDLLSKFEESEQPIVKHDFDEDMKSFDLYDGELMLGSIVIHIDLQRGNHTINFLIAERE